MSRRPNAVEPLIFRGAMSGSCTGGKQSFGDKCVPKPEFGNEETRKLVFGDEVTRGKTPLLASAKRSRSKQHPQRTGSSRHANRGWTRQTSRIGGGHAPERQPGAPRMPHPEKEARKCLCHLWSLWSRGAGELLVGRIRYAKEMRRFMPDRLGDARRKPEQ